MATILIIDDDITMLARLATQLTDVGYDVIKRSEAVLAEVVFVEQRPDMVLLEVKTSKGAGWQLLERFADQVPVIVVSAAGREEDIVRGLEAGAADYIAKPYRSAELLTRIRVRLNGAASHAGSHPAHTMPVVPLPDEDKGQQAASAAPQVQTEAAHATAHNGEAPAGEPTPAPAPVVRAPDEQASPEPASPAASTQGESVFMAENEELVLLRSNKDTPPEQQEVLTAKEESLGARLWAERQRRRVTLVQAENELHIRMWYLQAMEEEKFTLLPRGPMATQMLRSYASYLGLDVAEVLHQYERLHASQQIEVPLAFGSPRQWRIPGWLIGVVAVALALLVSFGSIMLLDPEGISALGQNVRGLVVASPTPEPTLTPTATPTPQPSATPTPEPSTTPTATIVPTPTPIPPPTVESGNR